MPHRVAVLASEGVYAFELGIPSRVLGAAGDRYEVMTCTVDGRPVRTNADFSVSVAHDLRVVGRADTVIVLPVRDDDLSRPVPEVIVETLRALRPGTRLLSICTGAFVLAAAGLLDGRPATTHWALADVFRAWHPAVRLDPDALFIEDGNVITAAGATAGIDACLHLIRSDHGSAVANAAARACVAPPWRDGGQAQYVRTPLPPAGDDGTAPARLWAVNHLGEALTVRELARRSNMSERTFLRRFTHETGTSPRRWLTERRIDRAKELLETTDLGVDDVARRVGFAGGTSLREHLHASIGVTPLAYRRTFRGRPDPGDAAH